MSKRTPNSQRHRSSTQASGAAGLPPRPKARRKTKVERLTELAKRGMDAWHEVDHEIERGTNKGYDRALRLLVDLGELATLTDCRDAYESQVANLALRHSRDEEFLDRLAHAPLGTGDDDSRKRRREPADNRVARKCPYPPYDPRSWRRRGKADPRQWPSLWPMHRVGA